MQVPALVVFVYLRVISVCMTVTWRAEGAAFLCNHTSCLTVLQSDHELSWNVAQHKCNDLDGGDLVSIDMIAQVNQVVNFVRNHSSISFEVWVGLRKDASSDCKGGTWPSLIFEAADSLLPLPGPNCSLKEDQCLTKTTTASLREP
uniref:C-type lectin domain-containing protein n=1 Tax=Eptatretus burgeri TaxID=7764 RepID=A0A8C4R199_EPTBU